MKPYVFGHRGASGYEVENTISSFKKAVNMGAGIEADVQLTKDKKLICFHDPYIKIEEKYCLIKDFTLKEVKAIYFKDNRKIPLLQEVFDIFKDKSSTLRFSFDVNDKQSGLKLINHAKKASILKNIEITDRRLILLSGLRRNNKIANLVYTFSEMVNPINSKSLNLDKLKKLNVNVVNVRCTRHVEDSFKEIIDKGLKCYIWGVNTQSNMKKIIKLKYKDEIVNAIYTDYPDKLLNLIMEHFK
ncbi:MAG: glycerophosphodiester phosphodiesterase [Promethearchaeota archaeon]|jgi:glycerophosphoryl diester phosphodiesterase